MIIATIYAMKAALSLSEESNEPLRKKVQLILGTQEEVEWTDMAAYVKEYQLPDYGFSLDGEYPICNIEKGCVDYTLEFNLDNRHLIKDCGDNSTTGEKIPISQASSAVL